MKRILKKLEQEFLTRRAYAVVVLLAMVFLFLPLLYIGQYNHISADCYWFARNPHFVWQGTHSVFEVLKCSLNVVKNMYPTWQGTFSSIFLFSLSPGVFGEQYYFIVPYIMIGMITFSTFVFYYVLLRKLLGFDRYTWFSISGVAAIMEVQFMDAGTSGLYCYNSAIHYTFMHGTCILAISFIILYLQYCIRSQSGLRRSLALVFSCIFSFIASGANFTSALLNLELLVIGLIAAIFICKKSSTRRPLFVLFPFFIGLIGFAVNALAPGNAVRQTYFTGNGPLQAILLSFSSALQMILEWTDIYVLMILLLLLPLILKACSKSSFCFSFPPFIMIGFYCLLSSMFTPAWYALGTLPIDRNLNICQLFYYLTLLFSEIYLVGWLEKRFRFIKKLVPSRNKNLICWSLLPIICSLFIIFTFQKEDTLGKLTTSNSYIAWTDIESGSAQKMWAEYLARLEVYKFSPDKIVYVEPYSVKPPLLFVNTESEIGTGDNRQISYDVAAWYGKEAIYETIPH